MSALHIPPQTSNLLQGIAEVSLATVVTLLSAVTAATLLYVWLFT